MHIDYEKSCCDLRWQVPVSVLLHHGVPENIHGPYEALNCLTHRWPDGSGEEKGEEHERARQFCMAAMGRRIPAGTARDAFIAASAAAGVLAGNTVETIPPTDDDDKTQRPDPTIFS